MCLGSWLQMDLITVEDLVTVVKGQSQGKKRKISEIDEVEQV